MLSRARCSGVPNADEVTDAADVVSLDVILVEVAGTDAVDVDADDVIFSELFFDF